MGGQYTRTRRSKGVIGDQCGAVAFRGGACFERVPSFFATGFSVCTQTPRPRRLAARGIQIDFGDGAGHFTQNSYALTIPGTDFNDNANILPGDFDGDGDIDLLSGRIVRRATVGANQAITINEDDELSFADGFESAGP